VITRNAIQCTRCDEVIESFHRHDFKYCSCKTVAVDGGKAYRRRLFTNLGDYIDLSEFIDQTEYE